MHTADELRCPKLPNMSDTSKSTGSVSPSKEKLASTAVGQLASQLTPRERDLALFTPSEQSIAAASTSTPKDKVMPNTAAAEFLDRFVQTLHCKPQGSAYRDMGLTFFAKFSTWYNESKSILKHHRDRSLIPKNNNVHFSFQATDRLRDNVALNERLDDINMVTATMYIYI